MTNTKALAKLDELIRRGKEVKKAPRELIGWMDRCELAINQIFSDGGSHWQTIANISFEPDKTDWEEYDEALHNSEDVKWQAEQFGIGQVIQKLDLFREEIQDYWEDDDMSSPEPVMTMHPVNTDALSVLEDFRAAVLQYMEDGSAVAKSRADQLVVRVDHIAKACMLSRTTKFSPPPAGPGAAHVVNVIFNWGETYYLQPVYHSVLTLIDRAIGVIKTGDYRVQLAGLKESASSDDVTTKPDHGDQPQTKISRIDRWLLKWTSVYLILSLPYRIGKKLKELHVGAFWVTCIALVAIAITVTAYFALIQHFPDMYQRLSSVVILFVGVFSIGGHVAKLILNKS